MTGKGYEKAFWGARKLLHRNMITYVLKKFSCTLKICVLHCMCVISQKKCFTFNFGSLSCKTSKDSKTVMRVLPVFSKPVMKANDNGMTSEGAEQRPFGSCAK